jgi:drug/metabolite transporter (DMT)-like permease
MSDGGAGAIFEIVSILSKSRAGRVVLLVVGCYLALQYVVSELSRAALFGIVVLLAGLTAIAVALFVQRRRRRERASLHQTLALVGLMIVGGATALFVLVRRRKAQALSAPPTAADVARLADAARWPR